MPNQTSLEQIELAELTQTVRFYYCNASDDLDQTAELVKIGRQPRRDAGAAAAQPLPAAPGPARKKVSTPDGKVIMYMDMTLKSITPKTFYILVAGLTKK